MQEVPASPVAGIMRRVTSRTANADLDGMPPTVVPARQDRRTEGVPTGRLHHSVGQVPPYSWFANLYDETTGFATYSVVRDAIERTLGRHQPAPDVAADVGCGTGLLLPYLASVADRVYAVDRSPWMLRLARERAYGLPVLVIHQDLRRLVLPEPANLITCTVHTLNYLLSEEELLLALTRFHRNLTPEGIIMFDLVTGTAWRGAPVCITQRLRHSGFAVISRIRTLPARRLSVVEMHLTTSPSCVGLKGRREVHVQRWYPLQVVRDLARRAGLWVREVIDLDRDRPATDASHWVHVVATPSPRG